MTDRTEPFQLEPWSHDFDTVDGWRLSAAFGSEGNNGAAGRIGDVAPQSIAITADSRWIVVGADHGVRIFELQSLRRCHWPDPFGPNVTSLALSADDQLIAVCQTGPMPRTLVAELASGRLLVELIGAPACASWPPDRVAFAKNLVLTGHEDGWVLGWRDGQVAWTARWGRCVDALAVSPDGSRCAWICETTGVVQFETATGRLDRVLHAGRLADYTPFVAYAGARVVACLPHGAAFFDMETGTTVGEPYALADPYESCSPSGVALVGPFVALPEACMYRIELQRREDRGRIGALLVPGGFASQHQGCVIASPDGRYLACAGRGGLLAWRIDDDGTVAPMREFGPPLPICSLAMDPLGNRVVAGGEGWGVVVDLECRSARALLATPRSTGGVATPDEEYGCRYDRHTVGVSPCAQYAVGSSYAGGGEHVLCRQRIEPAEVVQIEQREVFDSVVNERDTAVSADGGLVAFTYHRHVVVWCPADGSLRELDHPHATVMAVTWSTDGAALLLGGDAHDVATDQWVSSVSLLELPSGRTRWRWRDPPGTDAGRAVAAVALSPSGRWAVAAVSFPTRVLVWDARVGRLVCTVALQERVVDVAFLADDETLRVLTRHGWHDLTVVGNEIPGSRVALPLAGWGDAASRMACTPAGDRMAIGTAGGMLLVWASPGWPNTDSRMLELTPRCSARRP